MTPYASLKKRALRAFYVQAHRGPFKTIARQGLAARRKRVLHVATPAQAARETIPLAPAAQYRVKGPDHFGKPGPSVEDVFPAVGAHVLDGFTISPYSPGMLSEHGLLLPALLIEHRDRHLTDGNWMFDFDHHVAIGHERPTLGLPAAIHVGSAGAFNWYHFMLECLPKAFLASRLDARFDSYPLIVPEEARRYPTYAEALDIAAGRRPCQYLKPGEAVRADRIVALDDVHYGPFNLKEGCWPKVDDYAFHPDIMRSFIAHMRKPLLKDEAATPGEPTPARVYLVRKEGVRRDHNQAELLAIAEGFGFVPVAPETLSLREQARLFAGAECVVGASGAAWVGMMFGSPGLRGVSWLLREFDEFSAYSLLADLQGIRIEFLEAIPAQPVKSTHEAYLASYRVEPQAFAAALVRATEDFNPSIE